MISFSSVAEWPPDEASPTNHHHHSSVNSMSGNPQDGATPGEAELSTTIDPVYLTNDHASPSHISDRWFFCQWDACGKPVKAYRESITKHMTSYHCTSRLSNNSRLQCRWKDCPNKKGLRRDTLFRHVVETHVGIPRPGASGGSAMSPQS
jgi:hypothetical protein